MKKLIKPDGKIVIEVQYLFNTIKDLSFDNIYHEHTNYWSLTSLYNFLKKLKLNVFKVEKIDTHGGSIRIYVSQDDKILIDKSVDDLLKAEEKYGLKKISTYLEFGKKVEKLKKNFTKNFSALKDKKIIFYGSPAKATTKLNFFNIEKKTFKTVEDNPLKVGKYIPNVDVEICSKKSIKDKKLDYVIVLAWNYFEEIKNNNLDLSAKFISINDLEKK